MKLSLVYSEFPNVGQAAPLGAMTGVAVKFA